MLMVNDQHDPESVDSQPDCDPAIDKLRRALAELEADRPGCVGCGERCTQSAEKLDCACNQCLGADLCRPCFRAFQTEPNDADREAALLDDIMNQVGTFDGIE